MPWLTSPLSERNKQIIVHLKCRPPAIFPHCSSRKEISRWRWVWSMTGFFQCGDTERNQSHNYIDIHKLHCTGGSIIGSILRRFEGPPSKIHRQKKEICLSVCTHLPFTSSFAPSSLAIVALAKGGTAAALKGLSHTIHTKLSRNDTTSLKTHSALSLLLTCDALLSQRWRRGQAGIWQHIKDISSQSLENTENFIVYLPAARILYAHLLFTLSMNYSQLKDV